MIEWQCPECKSAGKYSEIHRGGVDTCPECRSEIENIEDDIAVVGEITETCRVCHEGKGRFDGCCAVCYMADGPWPITK